MVERGGRIRTLPPCDLPIPSPHEVGRGLGRGVRSVNGRSVRMHPSGVLKKGTLSISMASHVWIAHFFLRFGCGCIAVRFLAIRLTCDYAIHLTH
jgi:hypothetical protein